MLILGMLHRKIMMKFVQKLPVLPLACALGLGSLALTTASYAANAPAASSLSAQSQLKQVEATETLALKVQQGQLIQLPRAAASVLVADPEVASYQMPSPRNLFVFAQAAGKTTLYALDSSDKVIAAIKLDVSHDLDALTQQIEAEVPGAKVNFGPTNNNGLIVRGSVQTPQQAKQVMDSVRAYLAADDEEGGNGQGGGQGAQGGSEAPRVINQLKVELSSQVNISVRIVEVSRNLSSELGLNWELTLQDGDYFFRNGTALFDSGTNSFLPAAVTSNVVAGGFDTMGSSSVGGLLNALAENGLATVLAEPNLTAMSGETAGFAAGGEVPIVIVNNNNISIEYKQYGVIMRMTPTLLSPNRISLHVAPEVSDLSSDGAVTLADNVIPAFKVRRADTTVELASGQSFALAGMLRSNTSQSVRGVPGLKDIPGLGRLFESKTTEQEDTELVIIATAYVVEPTAAGSLQTPGKGIPTMDAALPVQASAGYLF